MKKLKPKTTGVQATGSGQSPENNTGNSSNIQTSSKNKSDTGNSVLKGKKMNQKDKKTTGVQGSGSGQTAENNTVSIYKKEIPPITKSDIGNSVIKGKKMKHNKKKYKHRKTTGVQGSGSGPTAEYNTGETNNIQPVIPEEDLRPRNILIDYDTIIQDLHKDLLKESYKNNPREISMYVIDAKEFSIKDIENLSTMINKRNLTVNLNAIDCIDFTGLVLFGLCFTGEVYFPDNTNIHMESRNSIPKNRLKRIAKKISKRTGVDAKDVIRLYNQNAIVEPCVIFPDDSDLNKILDEIGGNMKNIISISKETDLEQLGKELTAKSTNVNSVHTLLMIDNAKKFKISEIEKLGDIIKKIPLEVSTYVLNDMDLTEFALSNICLNKYKFIAEGVKITMDTIEQLTDEELKRISEIVAKFTGKDAEEISECYKKRDIIDINMILTDKNKKLK